MPKDADLIDLMRFGQWECPPDDGPGASRFQQATDPGRLLAARLDDEAGKSLSSGRPPCVSLPIGLYGFLAHRAAAMREAILNKPETR
jgi:hypothetical protein